MTPNETSYSTKTKDAIFRFSSLQTAQRFADGCERRYRIVLGHDEMYWVATSAAAERLVSQGYEYAPR